MIDYWTEDDLLQLNFAKDFSQIGKVAFKVQERMPFGLSQVCGPISTGGFNDLKKNLSFFNKTIQRLKSEGVLLFDQMPLESAIARVIKSLGDNFDPYVLLNEIYLPLFKSGKLKRVYFIRGWESSRGSRWEHEQAKVFGLEIVYLD